jgi:Tfp pilus assembly protein PilV
MIKKEISGFSLAEALVAIVIGMISIAAIFFTYQTFNKAYKSVESRGEMNSNARNALSHMSRELRNAGNKDINWVHSSLEEYLWKENNVSGFLIGTDKLKFYYDNSPNDRVRIDYHLKKYKNSNDTYLARTYMVQNCTAANKCTSPISIIDQVFIENVEDFQVVFIDSKGDEVKPVNFERGKANQALVKTIEIYLTVRSRNKIYNTNKNWTIKNADQAYAKFDQYHRDSYFVSVYPRNIIKN